MMLAAHRRTELTELTEVTDATASAVPDRFRDFTTGSWIT